jgi:hypothetical protein
MKVSNMKGQFVSVSITSNRHFLPDIGADEYVLR